MQVVENCFKEYEKDFCESLFSLDFTTEQATQFLSLVRSNVIESVEKTSVFETIACMLTRPCNSLSKPVDVGVIASQLALEQTKVSRGLDAIAQVLLIVCARQSAFSVSPTGKTADAC